MTSIKNLPARAAKKLESLHIEATTKCNEKQTSATTTKTTTTKTPGITPSLTYPIGDSSGDVVLGLGTCGELSQHLQQQPQAHPHVYRNTAPGLPPHPAPIVAAQAEQQQQQNQSSLDIQSRCKQSLDLMFNAREMNYLASLCSSDAEGRDHNEAIAAFAAGQQIPSDMNNGQVFSETTANTGTNIPEETLDQLRDTFPQTFHATTQAFVANQEHLPTNYWELFEPLQYTPPSRQSNDQSPTNSDVAVAEAIVASIESSISQVEQQQATMPIPIKRQETTPLDLDVSRQELNLRRSMETSQGSENLIREFDRAQGLRFCHSKTTLATSRSRNKLIKAMFGDEKKKKKRGKKKGGTRKKTHQNEQDANFTSSIHSTKPSAQASRSGLPSQLQRKGMTATTA